jgi:hypothetical protein
MNTPVRDRRELAFLEALFHPAIALKKAETFCLKLSAEVMAKKTEHFELINLHFEIDGLLATYKCAIDERTYEVKIVARD